MIRDKNHQSSDGDDDIDCAQPYNFITRENGDRNWSFLSFFCRIDDGIIFEVFHFIFFHFFFCVLIIVVIDDISISCFQFMRKREYISFKWGHILECRSRIWECRAFNVIVNIIFSIVKNKGVIGVGDISRIMLDWFWIEKGFFEGFIEIRCDSVIVPRCGIISEETLVFLKLLGYTVIAVSGMNKLVISVEVLKSHET